ncbi:MAG: hypothetical protein QOJ79_1204 [Actinomycetota bacterium]|jgi:hypothetical protein|nr:hypothetical protein [Actinomycetota bacterium]
MFATSPHAAEVFGQLRVAVSRELDTEQVAGLLDDLISRGWRPWQLRHRVGTLPTQATSVQDAEVITGYLRQLLAEPSPQARYDEEKARRRDERVAAAREAPVPAAPDDRERWIAVIRSGLKGRPRVVTPAPMRVRPDCALCQGESDFFVRRDVHLCARCVDLLAAGAVTAERQTGT